MSCLSCQDTTYKLVPDYSLVDARFSKNTNGISCCLWCYEEINYNDKIVACTCCNMFIGHMKCKESFCCRVVCPYCNE